MKVRMLMDHPLLEQIREGDRSYTNRVMLEAGDIYEGEYANELVEARRAEIVEEETEEEPKAKVEPEEKKVVEPEEKKVVEPKEKKTKKAKG